MPTRKTGKLLMELQEALVDEGLDEEDVSKLIDALEEDIDAMFEDGDENDEESSE